MKDTSTVNSFHVKIKRYVPLVAKTSRSFPRSWLITWRPFH